MAAEPNNVAIRLVTPADAPLVAWQRARMWEDMGDLPTGELFEALRARADDQFRDLIRTGDSSAGSRLPSATLKR